MRIKKGVPRSDDEVASETVRDRSKSRPSGDDADFLVEEFDVPPHEAADLVSDDAREADAVEDSVRRRNRDATGDGLPLPSGDDDDIVPDNDEVRDKPVVQGPNRRTGAG